MIYHFKGRFQPEEDVRWSAWVDSLPGCSTWGYTQEEATQALHEAAILIVEDMLANGEDVPTGSSTNAVERSQQDDILELSIGIPERFPGHSRPSFGGV